MAKGHRPPIPRGGPYAKSAPMWTVTSVRSYGCLSGYSHWLSDSRQINLNSHLIAYGDTA